MPSRIDAAYLRQRASYRVRVTTVAIAVSASMIFSVVAGIAQNVVPSVDTGVSEAESLAIDARQIEASLVKLLNSLDEMILLAEERAGFGGSDAVQADIEALRALRRNLANQLDTIRAEIATLEGVDG